MSGNMRLGTSMGLTMAQAPQPGATSPAAPSAPDLSPEELLRYIVDHINTVLQRTYSLVDFDGLRGVQLLQVVNDVFATLQPSMAADMESSQLEEVIPRMLDFLLKTLGYRVPQFIQGSFPQSFADAEPTVVYPTLYWLLTHMEQSHKRVYLSRFLQQLDIPDDIRSQDEDVRALYEQYQHLRTTFVQTHRRVDNLRTTFADPAEARRKATALEEERDLLNQYITVAQKKLANVPDKEALLVASRSLRLAMEEDSKLAEKRVEQQQAKISAEVRRTEISNRLQNLRRDAADGRVDVMVRRMKDEIQTNQIKLNEQLPMEIEVRRSENAELQRLLSEPLDMAALTAQDRKLDEELRGLRETVRERQRPGEDGTSIATIKNQVSRVASRKAEVMNDLVSLQADNNKALNDIRERELRITQLRSATNMLKGDDFREFANKVRAKKAATEGMRTRIAELRAEWGVLTFTESALQARYDELEKLIGNLESKLGLQGYSRTVEALSQLSEERDAIEEMKGKTLDELSRVVQDFTLAIREGRTKLAPLINELRTFRQTAEEVEQEWSEKKSQYDYQKALMTEDIQALDAEVSKLKEEVARNESLYHRMKAQLRLVNVMGFRAQQEKNFRDKPETFFDVQYKTYGAYFADMTKMLEARTRDLQTKRRDVEENHESSAQQVEWFHDLHILLAAKLKALSMEGGTQGGAAANTVDDDIQHVMGHGYGGADMLVLNSNLE